MKEYETEYEDWKCRFSVKDQNRIMEYGRRTVGYGCQKAAKTGTHRKSGRKYTRMIRAPVGREEI